MSTLGCVSYRNLIAIVVALLLLGCTRTYHVYNYVDNESILEQHITVAADVPKTVDTAVDATVDVSVIP